MHEESSPRQTVRATEQKQIPVVPTGSHQIDCGYNEPSTLLIECRASRNGHVYASSKQPRIRVLANRLYGLQPQRLLILRAGQHFEGGRGADLSLVVSIDQELETLLRLRLAPRPSPCITFDGSIGYTSYGSTFSMALGAGSALRFF